MPRLPAFDPATNVNRSPHVVILGAGASIAAFPSGDRNGKKLPSMLNFVETLELLPFIQEQGLDFQFGNNFEEFYSRLYASEENKSVREELERRIYDYFSSLETVESPTLYDYLLLTLRPKDLIATFNWDPFLAQAYRRNAEIRELPQIAFLHGNVAIGICEKDQAKGFLCYPCQTCGRPFTPARLLYPITQKNYQSDAFIRDEWKRLTDHLNYGYLLTIFGYSAPKSDVEAKALLKNAWKANETKELAEIEIVDIKTEKELRQTWQEFITRNHYGTDDKLQTTYMFRHPRRTCEAFAAATLMNAPWMDDRVPSFASIKEFHSWIQPYLQEELKYNQTKTPFSTLPPSRA